MNMILNQTVLPHNGTEPFVDPTAGQKAIMFMVALTILLVNIPVFIIVPHQVPSLKRSMRYTMISLALTDSALGLQALFRLIHQELYSYDLNYYSILCHFDGIFNNFLASISILSLSWLSLDKLLIVKYPLHHKDFMSKRKILLILVLIWSTILILYMPSIVLGSGQFDEYAFLCIGNAYGNLHGIVIVTLVHIIPSTTIFVCFIKIWLIVRKSQQFRRKNSMSWSNHAEQTQKENTRMIVTLVIMSIGYYIMWVPFFVTVPYWELATGHSLSAVSDFITCWLGAANSMINPLIYIPTITPYRHALYNLITFTKHLPPQTQTPLNSRSLTINYSEYKGVPSSV